MTDIKEKNANLEQLSSLVDDNLTAADAGFLLRQLDVDDELKQRWNRYQIISAVARDEVLIAPPSFASGVMAAIANEEQEVATTASVVPSEKADHPLSSVISGWFKPALGLGLAAAVAMVSVVVLRDSGDSSNGDALLASTSTNNNSTQTRTAGLTANPEPNHIIRPVALTATNIQGSAPVEEPVAEWTLASPEAQTRLNAYLINHAEYGSIGAGRGMMQYARLVGQGQGKQLNALPVNYQPANGNK